MGELQIFGVEIELHLKFVSRFQALRSLGAFIPKVLVQHIRYKDQDSDSKISTPPKFGGVHFGSICGHRGSEKAMNAYPNYPPLLISQTELEILEELVV